LAVKDAATDAPYWELLSTDGAGRIETERFGGGSTTTTRSYFDEKDRVKNILTKAGATTVQSLSYEYDDRLNLTHRTDARQGKTESFGYDLLDRVTGSSFSPLAHGNAYIYSQNGNLLTKPGVGNYVYDPAHPHAVLIAGGEIYGNDAVGNQRIRPGATIKYTTFDLPKTFTLDGGAGTIDLDYDGNQERVRKSAPKAETVYFGSLYERVTKFNSGEVTHRYYVYSSERLVATVTRQSGAEEKTQ
jgi:YD repeat-containing protein